MELEAIAMVLEAVDTLGVVAFAVWRLMVADRLVDALIMLHERGAADSPTAQGDRPEGD